MDLDADYGPDLLDIYGDDIPTSDDVDGRRVGEESDSYSITLDRYDYYLSERGGNIVIDVAFDEEE